MAVVAKPKQNKKGDKIMAKTKLRYAGLIVVAILTMMIAATMAEARDKILVATAQSVVQDTDKNGNQYIRVIINEKRKLKGIEYEVGVPVMFFGSTIAQGQTIQEGQEFKAIVSDRFYQGRKSYMVIKLLNE